MKTVIVLLPKMVLSPARSIDSFSLFLSQRGSKKLSLCLVSGSKNKVCKARNRPSKVTKGTSCTLSANLGQGLLITSKLFRFFFGGGRGARKGSLPNRQLTWFTCEQSYKGSFVTSVTIWMYYLFKIWPSTAMK